LSIYPRDVASFAAGLNNYGLTALNKRCLKVLDFKNAIRRKIRADDQQHQLDYRLILLEHLFKEVDNAGVAFLAKPEDSLLSDG